jgi:hypothetical protein
LLQNNLFRIDAGKRSVVLMDAVNCHSINRRPGCFCQSLTPLNMGVVQQPGPVHDTNDDRLPGPDENISDRFERIVNGFDGLNPSTAQRVSHWWRDVESKCADMKISCGLKSKDGRG